MASSFPIAVSQFTPSRVGVDGPKSAAGKSRSSVNARKHDLSSANPAILDHETVEAWEAFRDAFVSELHPVGPVEVELARDRDLTQRRSRRKPLSETQSVNTRLSSVEGQVYQAAVPGAEDAEMTLIAADALNQPLLPAEAVLDQIIRYEAHPGRLQKSRRQETENCKTNSPPTHSAPTPSGRFVPPVPSVPLVPSDPALGRV